MGTNAEQPPHFLNVDLDLESTAPLDALIAGFDPGAFALHRDALEIRQQALTYVASLELTTEAPTADACIAAFCTLVEGFDATARDAWFACAVRCFDIGLESGAHGKALVLDLAPEALRRSLALGATIRVTLYSIANDG